MFLLPSDAINVRGMATLLVCVRESRDVEDAYGECGSNSTVRLVSV